MRYELIIVNTGRVDGRYENVIVCKLVRLLSADLFLSWKNIVQIGKGSLRLGLPSVGMTVTGKHTNSYSLLLISYYLIFMNISFAAEKIVGSPITNSVLTGVVASLIIIALVFWLTRSIKMNPSKKQNFAEWAVEGILSLTQGITGSREAALKILPLGATFFLFIIVNNWLGLVPGVGSIGFDELHHGEEVFVPLFRSANADLNTTLALALISVGATQYFGVSKLRLGYFKKFINFSSFIDFFMGILEIISEFAKIISFSFRLFGNVFAGEVLLGVITGLLPYIAPLPFYGLEIFVGFVQALVFAMLSLVFFHVAQASHAD